MLKILSVLSAVGMSATLASSVVACTNKQDIEPATSSVDENGILTSQFEMLLKKESILFGPLSGFSQPDESYVQIHGLALIDSDKDSLLQNNGEIYRELKSTFKVKYKDIKDSIAKTKDKLDKDIKVKVYLTSDVKKLQSAENSKVVILNVTNNFDGKINGAALPIIVELPRLKVTPKPKPVNPAPVVPKPITPDKPDHYIPSQNPCTNNDDVGLLTAEMNDSGTIIDVQLTKPANIRINKDQILVTDSDGNKVNVYNVLSEAGDGEVVVILDSPVSKDTNLKICILGIANKDELVNVINVDMSKCKYVPAGWAEWESIWSLTKKTAYYGAAFSWSAFKLAVRTAFLICPCSWPCEIVATCFDVTWVPKYMLNMQHYV